MNESGITIAKLLELKPEHVRSTLTNLTDGEGRHAADPSSLNAFLTDQAAEAVNAALDRDVFELIFNAISGLRELHEYVDSAKHPPSERAIVEWGKCSLNAPQVIELKLGEIGLPISPFRFTLNLSAEFKSLTLTIQAGAIHKIAPGPAKASVGLKYGEATVIPTKSTPEIRFEQALEFTGGLPII